MGKWASYKKRGGASGQGTFAAPIAADFSIGTLTSTTIPVNRLGSYPAGVTTWAPRAIEVSPTPGIANLGGSSAGTAVTITALTSGRTYKVQVVWGSNIQAQSDWTTIGQVTLP